MSVILFISQLTLLLQVLYYLVRMEPFTTLSIQLQGGKFDHADRMFSDIGATWNGVLEDMSDVKELVRIYLTINAYISVFSLCYTNSHFFHMQKLIDHLCNCIKFL